MSAFNKLLVCLANEGTGAAFSFGGLAVDSLLVVELFLPWGVDAHSDVFVDRCFANISNALMVRSYLKIETSPLN